MTIDTARLATDAGYWDEVAPKGAEQFGPDEGLFIAGWYKNERDGVYFMPEDGSHWQLTYPMQRELIPRPQSEWVGGLPPVGAVCIFKDIMRDGGIEVEVIAHKNEYAIYWHDGNVRQATAKWFRPIPTKAQRDRDELCDIASRYSDLGHVIADDIIAAGWTKP